MEIQSIKNQTNFKSIYRTKGVKFSNIQEKIIKDIEKKVEPDKNFLVNAGAYGHSVELYKLEDFAKKTDNISFDSKSWKKQLYIGTYDEEKLYQSKDLLNAEKKEKETKKKKKNNSISLAPILGILAAIFSIMLCERCAAKTKDLIPILKDHTVNSIESSFQKNIKNTLDLTKKLMNK